VDEVEETVDLRQMAVEAASKVGFGDATGVGISVGRPTPRDAGAIPTFICFGLSFCQRLM
jgi:hypothetical protein